MSVGTVIVGASHAGVQCAASLRDMGYDGAVTLIGDDPAPPYHRPPLSKGFMTGTTSAEGLTLRSDVFFREAAILFRPGTCVARIDRDARRVVLADGSALSYDHLVLATGTRPRRWPGDGLPADAHMLRTMDDACRLRAHLARTDAPAVVIGGGYVGLELAATLCSSRSITVVEGAPRLLMRAASPALAALIARRHMAAGTHVLTDVTVTGFVPDGPGRTCVVLSNGRSLPAGPVIVGIGVVPNQELAAAAGLPCADGVLVDATCRTEDASIFAIGDCARFPMPRLGGTMRLECVQNAHDQARIAAAAIAGRPGVYDSVPWFWSDQLGSKFQTAGIVPTDGLCVTRGDPDGGKGAFFHYVGDALRAVETIDAPALHMQARRLIGTGISPSHDQASDAGFDLRSL